MESTVLALAGGAGGLLITVWAVPALTALAPKSLPRLAEIAVDDRTFLFTLALSLITGAVCGVAPMVGFGKLGADVLRSSPTVGRGHRGWLRPVLVTLQVSLAVVLLVGSGLLARSLVAVHKLDLGFDPRNVLTFGVYLLRSQQYNGLGPTREFARDVSTRLSALPEVVAAANGLVPLVGGMSSSVEVEDRREKLDAGINVSGPGYFRALGIPLHFGRSFTDADDKLGVPVVIVNQALAQAAWGTSEALGRRLRVSGDSKWLNVVGIVGDTRRSSLEATPPPIAYLPYLQTTVAFSSTFVIRTSGPAMNALPSVRNLVREIDPAIPVTRVATMDDLVAQFTAPREFNLWLIGLFSLVAFVLAVVGLYGLVSEVVTARTSEIGLRKALGASRFAIVRVITGESVVVTIAGVALGLAGAIAVSRWLSSMIFGVVPLDPVTLVAVPIVLLASSAIAAAAPARRALRVDAMSMLRRD
jgi:putative ABC transport system permease protein